MEDVGERGRKPDRGGCSMSCAVKKEILRRMVEMKRKKTTKVENVSRKDLNKLRARTENTGAWSKWKRKT